VSRVEENTHTALSGLFEIHSCLNADAAKMQKEWRTLPLAQVLTMRVLLSRDVCRTRYWFFSLVHQSHVQKQQYPPTHMSHPWNRSDLLSLPLPLHHPLYLLLKHTPDATKKTTPLHSLG
jgi:hypothetical protein